MSRKRYSVLATAEVDVELEVLAESPLQAVELAAQAHPGRWKQLEGFGLKPASEGIDSVTERRKNGRAFSVEWDDGGFPHVDVVDDNEALF